jgi:hypothetical protein
VIPGTALSRPGLLPGPYVPQCGDALYLSRTCTWLFQKISISFTWKWSQDSAEKISNSASKDIAPDFTEGSICRTGQVRCQQNMTKGLVYHTMLISVTCLYGQGFLTAVPLSYPLSPKKIRTSWAAVAPTCNPSYSGGRDQEDHGLKLDQANGL